MRSIRRTTQNMKYIHKFVFLFSLLVLSQAGGWTSVHAYSQIYPVNDVPCVSTDTFAGVWYNSSFAPATPQPILPNTNPPWPVWGGFGCATSYDLQASMVSISAPSGNYTFVMGDNGGGNMVEPWSYGYFYWNGTDVTSSIQNASSTSNIVNYVSPISSPTPSTNVVFEFDYWNTGFESFAFSGVEIRDVTAGYSYVPVEEAVILTGSDTYSQSYTLTAGHAHLWRPYLRATSTTTPTLYGNWVGLIDVVTDSASSTPIGGNFVTSSSTSPLRYKLPFIYFYDIRQMLQAPSVSTSTIALALNFRGIGTTTLLSSETVRYFFPDNVATAFRTLSSFAIIFGFLYAMWRSIMDMIQVRT